MDYTRLISENLHLVFSTVGNPQPVLILVPCGNSKVWNTDPDHGPAMAVDAYTGTPFKLNRQYAEQFGDDWVILSAK